MRGLALLLAALPVAACAEAAGGGAGKAPILLSCRPDSLVTPTLCADMAAAIRAAEPGRTVALAGDAPGLAGWPVALVIETRTDQVVAAHLEFGGPADLRRGPSISMRVMDTVLSGPLLSRYFSDLWAQSRQAPVSPDDNGASP